MSRSNTTTDEKSAGGSFVELQDPPRYDWAKIEQRCKRNPGKYLEVFSDDRHSVATSVNQGSVRRLTKDAGFRVRTRRTHYVDGVRRCQMLIKYDPALDKTKGKSK